MFAHRFRKKPVEVMAVQFTNNNDENIEMDKIIYWINSGKGKEDLHAWHNGTNIFIQTLEGTMKVSINDYVIKGVKGEYYPCKPDIFLDTYEQILV